MNGFQAIVLVFLIVSHHVCFFMQTELSILILWTLSLVIYIRHLSSIQFWSQMNYLGDSFIIFCF